MPYRPLRLQPGAPRSYCTSLAELDRIEVGAPCEKHVYPLRDAPRLLVCHDFQGGYKEHAHACGYTFEHWASTDVFVYFSHHRVSLPPPSYIHAAQRHGTRVLGTLLFEWDDARPDLARLLDGPRPRVRRRGAFSRHYADLLIALAAARGVDGYLINVEVSLTIRGHTNAYLAEVDARRDAERMRQWVAYLRTEGERRVPSWYVVWYDSVTYPEGKLAWQDALTPANAPYFQAAQAGFTNYTWAGPNEDPASFHPALAFSAAMADSMAFARAAVYVGIDVFGRNCYGGHDVWKSLASIGPQRKQTQVEAAPVALADAVASVADEGTALGLSVALFAPGWTWEHDVPGALRSWTDWWEEDCALWVDGPHAIAHSFPARPVPWHRTWRTNFCLGAGSAWYVRGEQVDGRPWTDASVSAPKPSLAWPAVQYVCTSEGTRIDSDIRTALVDTAWSGGSALEVQWGTDTRTRALPLVALESREETEASLHLYTHGAVRVTPCLLGAAPQPRGAVHYADGPRGWTRSTVRVRVPIGSFHVGCIAPPTQNATVLVGQVDLDAARAADVQEATWAAATTVAWPPFATEGYELFVVGQTTTWLGTAAQATATLTTPLDDDQLLEIRRIGAWPDDPVVYTA